MQPELKSEQSTTKSIEPSLLGLFSYAWAAQSLIQLVFFKGWFETSQVVGWVYLFFSLAVFIFPGRVRLFVAMLVVGLAYYITNWPFVVNHHIADNVLAFLMLGAALSVLGFKLFGTKPILESESDRFFNKFAPVAGAIFAFVYFSIIVSKLNTAFFDLDISCLSGMIEEAEAGRPLISPLLGLFSVEFYFWFFIVAETALPIMLAFRRTRLAAFYFGVPFHILLGLMGHWPFSAMMISLYVLVCAPMLKDILVPIIRRLETERASRLAWISPTILFALFNVLVVISAFIGKPSWTWLLWTSGLAAIILFGALREHMRHGLFGGTGVINVWVARPGILWCALVIAVMNSSGPYLGWKTESSIAMYSNMRTEGGINNHYFMPVLPLFGFQDDLVEVMDSNNDEILDLMTHPARYGFVDQEFKVYQAYFEFRRAVSSIEQDDLEITYLRNGELRTFKRGAEMSQDANLDTPPPIWLAKLLYFRPVYAGETSYCLH